MATKYFPSSYHNPNIRYYTEDTRSSGWIILRAIIGVVIVTIGYRVHL